MHSAFSTPSPVGQHGEVKPSSGNVANGEVTLVASAMIFDLAAGAVT